MSSCPGRLKCSPCRLVCMEVLLIRGNFAKSKFRKLRVIISGNNIVEICEITPKFREIEVSPITRNPAKLHTMKFFV